MQIQSESMDISSEEHLESICLQPTNILEEQEFEEFIVSNMLHVGHLHP